MIIDKMFKILPSLKRHTTLRLHSIDVDAIGLTLHRRRCIIVLDVVWLMNHLKMVRRFFNMVITFRTSPSSLSHHAYRIFIIYIAKENGLVKLSILLIGKVLHIALKIKRLQCKSFFPQCRCFAVYM